MASPEKTPESAHTAPSHSAPGAQATIAVVEHGSHGSPSVFPPFDKSTFGPQLVWLALTFGFLYFMLAKRLLPRVGQIIDERAESIRRDLTEAEHLKSETETSLKSYEQALTAAKGSASGIAKAQRDALAAETDKERAALDAQMATKIADAEKRIEANKKTAMAAVSGVAAETVGAIVAKVTGQSVDNNEIAQAIAAVQSK